MPTPAYEFRSELHDTFLRIIQNAPTTKNHKTLHASLMSTPLGPMMAIADENALYLLEFMNRRGLEREVKQLQKKLNAHIIAGKTEPIESITKELIQYFQGTLKIFKTPLYFVGSPFQNQVWQELQKIPHGQTRSYADIAKTIERPSAFRAVARANSTNQLALIIPCHRVINSNGKLGGYAAGLPHKKWLLNHEKQKQ